MSSGVSAEVEVQCDSVERGEQRYNPDKRLVRTKHESGRTVLHAPEVQDPSQRNEMDNLTRGYRVYVWKRRKESDDG